MGRDKEQNRLRKACPTEVIVRRLSFRSKEAQLILFSLKEIGDVVDPGGKCAASTQKFLYEAVAGIAELAPKLGKERREFVQAEREKDEWASPSCVDGWMCPDSPSGACEYENEDEDKDPDSCDHCGHPGERK